MTSRSHFTLAFLGLVACASPAREAAPRSVAGSTWAFCGQSKETVTFEAGGAVTFKRDGTTSAPGLACGDARWTQDAARVTFACHQFTEYKVTVSGDEMRGEWRRIQDPGQRSPTCLNESRDV